MLHGHESLTKPFEPRPTPDPAGCLTLSGAFTPTALPPGPTVCVFAGGRQWTRAGLPE